MTGAVIGIGVGSAGPMLQPIIAKVLTKISAKVSAKVGAHSFASFVPRLGAAVASRDQPAHRGTVPATAKLYYKHKVKDAAEALAQSQLGSRFII